MGTACKVVVIGDSSAGKTSLIHTYINKTWSEGFEATAIDKYTTKVTLSDKTSVHLELWDTAGVEDYQRLRALAYRNALVILLCFSVESMEANENISKYWLKEIRRYCAASTPILLVGCKVDIRDNAQVRDTLKYQHLTPVTLNQALALAQRIGACKYVECSARQGTGLTLLFRETAILAFRCRQARERQTKKTNCLNCSVM